MSANMSGWRGLTLRWHCWGTSWGGLSPTARELEAEWKVAADAIFSIPSLFPYFMVCVRANVVFPQFQFWDLSSFAKNFIPEVQNSRTSEPCTVPSSLSPTFCILWEKESQRDLIHFQRLCAAMECAELNLESTAGTLSEFQRDAALLSISFQELPWQCSFLTPEINFHPSVADKESSKTGLVKAQFLQDKKTDSTGHL